MNEQDNNMTVGSQEPQQSAQPVQETNQVTTQPVMQPAQDLPQEQVTPAVSEASVVDNSTNQQMATQPVAGGTVSQEVTPEPVIVQPVDEVKVEATPVQAATEVVTEVDTSVVQEVAPQPVVSPTPEVVVQNSVPVQPEVTPVVTEKVPVATQEPVQPGVQQPTVAPTQAIIQPTIQPAAQGTTQPTEAAPVQTDIVPQAPLNPLANEPTTPQTVAPSTPVAPATPVQPMSGAVNSNSVGFVAASAGPKKKKNKGLIITIVIAVIAAIAALAYFVIVPFVVEKFLSNPKNVYETVIRTAFKEIGTTVEEVVHDKGIYDIQLAFDSNMESLADYSGYTYDLKYGVDPGKKAIETSFTIKDSNGAGYSYANYLKDNKQYIRYSSYRDLIYAGEADMDEASDMFASFNDMLGIAEKVNSEDISYLTNKLADLLVGSIDESKLTREEASIKINGEVKKVANNKYEIDSATANKMMEHIVNGIKDDEKAVAILAEMLEMTEQNLKDSLTSLTEEDDTDDEEVEDDTVIILNIYTTTGLKSDVVGYAITTNESDSEIHYYNTDDYFEVKVYLVTKDEETNKDVEYTITAVGKTTNGKTNVSVSYNDNEIMTLNVKDWTDTLKELEYKVFVEDSELSGVFKYATDVNDERGKYALEFSMEMGSEYLNIAFEFAEDWTSEVANINVGNAVTLSDDEIAEKHTEFMNLLTATPIGVLFSTVSGDYTTDIEDYYDDYDYDYDYDYSYDVEIDY